MKILALIVILATLPMFLGLLSLPRHRRWAFVALGALPILYVPLNLDASMVSWPHWLGHTRGLIVTRSSIRSALAICLRYAPGRPVPPSLWAFGLYFFWLFAAQPSHERDTLRRPSSSCFRPCGSLCSSMLYTLLRWGVR